MMRTWSNLRNAENGRYKLSTMVFAALFAISILWQGVFAMLGTTGVDVGDGLHEQRAAAWSDAVANPAEDGGVWGQFWANAQFGGASGDSISNFLFSGLPSGATVTSEGGGFLALPLGTLFDYNGITWRVVERVAGAALIITEYVHGVGAVYNTTNVYTRLSHSALQGTLDTWAQDNLGTLRQRALLVLNVDADVRDEPGGDFRSDENEDIGRTRPAPFPPIGENTGMFIFSLSEVNHYFGANNTSRTATDVTGARRNWWTRSPSALSNEFAIESGMAFHPTLAISHAGGTTSLAATNETVGFRPALWISV